jgi:RNA polymerase sigma-70 factor (ECF subfamily)
MGKEKEKQNQSQLEDRVLIEDFHAKNVEAFDKLVIKYQDMIFNLCYRLLGDYDESHDCAQETFIKVYRNLNGFKFKSSFSTWIYRIAVNTCKNYLASSATRMKKKMIRLDNPGRPGNGMRSIDIHNGSSNPATLFERREKERDIQRAIDSLPRNQRILVVLRDIEGKTYEEIGKITGLKSGTIKSKLSRARHNLRERLTEVASNEL